MGTPNPPAQGARSWRAGDTHSTRIWSSIPGSRTLLEQLSPSTPQIPQECSSGAPTEFQHQSGSSGSDVPDIPGHREAVDDNPANPARGDSGSSLRAVAPGVPQRCQTGMGRWEEVPNLGGRLARSVWWRSGFNWIMSITLHAFVPDLMVQHFSSVPALNLVTEFNHFQGNNFQGYNQIKAPFQPSLERGSCETMAQMHKITGS